MTKRKAPVVTPRDDIIEFVLDETGSMIAHKIPTINGFNSFLSEQRKQDNKCLITLTKFSTSRIHTPYANMDINIVPEMTTNTFIPDGGTNLYDTILSRLEKLNEQISKNTNALFVVLTDGDENASRATKYQTREAISKAIGLGIACVFLGAYQGALKAASELGFPKNNSKCFSGSEMYNTFKTLSASTTAYRAGTTTSKEFFS